MDPISILKGLKDKVLDANNFDILKHVYDLQNQNIEQLKNNNEALKESNQLLRDQADRIQKENAFLKKQIDELSKKISEIEINTTSSGTKPAKLEKEKEKILVLLSSTTRRLPPQYIADSLNINLTKVEYHLGEMEDADLIYSNSDYTDEGYEYYLLQKGREYLVKHDLLRE